MARFWILVLLGVAATAAGIAWYVAPVEKPLGYAGVEFSDMTEAASARAPLLTSRGALIYDVTAQSPADKAGLHAGEVVAAIDGVAISSAAQAAGMVRAHRPGERATLTLFDEPKGALHPSEAVIAFTTPPPQVKQRSVQPPRTLAREFFNLPSMAANAAWSRRIARGPTIKPLEMRGLGAGRCNGFAPETWFVAGHAGDDSMIHVMAPTGFEHAVYQSAELDGRDPQAFVEDVIARDFEARPVAAALERQPFGFALFKFGTPKGAAGFAEYRVRNGRIALWIAAVAAADAAWAEPETGAVAFSLHCQSPGAPAPLPRDRSLPATSVSTRCLEGACGEGDFAAQYLSVLKLGYVHGDEGDNWLVKPKSDFWQNGADGPGFYRQIGGENEKLEPGRTN